MIDPTNRISRLLQEARDPQVGVIVMDFVLGFGAHEIRWGDDRGDQRGTGNRESRQPSAGNSRLRARHRSDPQSLAQQCQLLTDAGVIWASSSTNTGLLAREFVCKGERA